MHAITAPVNNFMVRLGHLKAVALSATTRSEMPEKLARKVYSMIGTPFEITLAGRQSLIRYLGAKSFEGKKRKPRYPDVVFQIRDRQEFLTWASGSLKGEVVDRYRIECQDAYLADPRLPSNLGAVGEGNANELVNWAGWTSIINSRRHSIHSFGHALNLLTRSEHTALSQFIPEHNPYDITAQRLFFLYLLLLQDGEVLCRLYEKLADLDTFSRMDAVPHFKAALEELREKLRKAGSMKYLQHMRELKNLSDAIEAQRERSERKGIRALTGMQRVSPRLENLVDLGLLENTSADDVGLKLRYEYAATERTRDLKRLLSPHADSLDEFLTKDFFSVTSELFGMKDTLVTDEETVFRFFIDAYRRYPRELGGKPIGMLALVAACEALNAKVGYFELETVQGILNVFRARYVNKIRLSGGHLGGGLEFVVIDDDLVERYLTR